MSELPTFEDMRRRAYPLLGDVEDELRSGWRPKGPGPPGNRHRPRMKRESASGKRRTR